MNEPPVSRKRDRRAAPAHASPTIDSAFPQKSGLMRMEAKTKKKTSERKRRKSTRPKEEQKKTKKKRRKRTSLLVLLSQLVHWVCRSPSSGG